VPYRYDLEPSGKAFGKSTDILTSMKDLLTHILMNMMNTIVMDITMKNVAGVTTISMSMNQ
jgi:hypothetical protein